MAISLQREWRVPGNAELVWRQWDDEYVIHHLLSNDTYRLTELPGALIDYLSRSGPRSTIDIAAHLQKESPVGGVAVSDATVSTISGGSQVIGTERVCVHDTWATIWMRKRALDSFRLSETSPSTSQA
jgi:hypothetical protein